MSNNSKAFKMPVTSVAGHKDVAWAPSVPFGHTGYTWMSSTTEVPVPSQKALGCTTTVSELKKTPEAAPKTEKKQEKPKEAEPAVAGASFETLADVDFVVGQIVSVKNHPDADSLYVEEIDVGEQRGGVRVIVSGLVKHVPIEEMQNRKVVVIANLKPSALRGIVSNGMVLAAKNETKVVLVDVPADAKPGDRVIPVGYEELFSSKSPAAEINAKKSNSSWSKVVPFLKTDENGVATFDGVPFAVNGIKLTAAVSSGILS